MRIPKSLICLALSLGMLSCATHRERFFVVADQNPSFPGGDKAMQAFIGNNLNLPYLEGSCNVQGRIVVQFFVEENGRLTHLRVVKPMYPAYDEACLKMLKKMPRWIPARQNGKPVRFQYILPIFIHPQ
ncbi:energy transducer TonB [Prevotella sp. KH2C16]|uniref:energy transducer TonB n=1 Tax=Prevotella sp. KH2C16 TaxID=1855325 RepID=UPI0008EDC9D4|nr:energy transducer TonB [Prevotella sp. KH2C16]SFG29414.1 protein TonB [Prevotella sp. KH2C16]